MIFSHITELRGRCDGQVFSDLSLHQFTLVHSFAWKAVYRPASTARTQEGRPGGSQGLVSAPREAGGLGTGGCWWPWHGGRLVALWERLHPLQCQGCNGTEQGVR